MRFVPKCAPSSGRRGAAEVVPASTMGDASDGPSRDGTTSVARTDGRRHQARAAERDGAAAARTAARPANELRRAVFRPTTSGRPTTARPAISATGTSSPSSTRSWRSKDGDKSSTPEDRRDQDPASTARRYPRSSSTRATPRSKCTRGDWAIIKTAPLDLPALQARSRRSPTTSPSRSSGWATTTRRASSCRPATSASGRPTAWSPA